MTASELLKAAIAATAKAIGENDEVRYCDKKHQEARDRRNNAYRECGDLVEALQAATKTNVWMNNTILHNGSMYRIGYLPHDIYSNYAGDVGGVFPLELAVIPTADNPQT